MGRWGEEPGVIQLPDGRRVRGSGTRRPRDADQEPEFAVYLLSRDPGAQGWPHRWISWPDFRVPRSSEQAIRVLREALERTEQERVEIACGGGVGRTGTALALLAAWGGVPADAAVGWVRERYHRRAVETPAQKRWVIAAARGAFEGEHAPEGPDHRLPGA